MEKRGDLYSITSPHNDLYHHGIKGQKWGVRRFQNKDGTLTKLGKSRYSDETNSKRKVSDWSDDELKSALDRLRMEQEYSKLRVQLYENNQKYNSVTMTGKQVVATKMKNILGKSVENVATEVTTDLVRKAVKKAVRAAERGRD